MGKALDKFGEFVVTKLRDAIIDQADALLSAHWKAPSVQDLQAALQGFTAEQRAIVRRCVVESADSGVHDFLFAMQEEHDAGGGLRVVVDGQIVAAESDGLHGEPFTDDGWYSRFSKHGPHPDKA
jgi:hypothetical protein